MINKKEFNDLTNQLKHESIGFLKTFLTELKKLDIKKHALPFQATFCALRHKMGYRNFIEFYKSI